MLGADLWQRGCERLATELPEQQFNTWIRPLPPAVVADGVGIDALVFSLRVPNRFKLDWIRNQYAGRIESILTELAGKPARLELALAAREPMARPIAAPSHQPMAVGQILHNGLRPVTQPAVQTAVQPAVQLAANAASHLNLTRSPKTPGQPLAQAAQPQATGSQQNFGQMVQPPQGRQLQPAQPQSPPQNLPQNLPPSASRHRINSALTFDNLVPGRANQMARTAALHVAGAPGQMYNPLFIYGGVGLGKTHLIHAVGNALLRDKPDARVLYLHAEQFISDVVKNYQRKTFDELKAKYHSLDLLLIDDVQFFAGKERTQEEFFNAFEALLAKRAHIIMTSDTYPKGLADIDERLTSRFDAGLTVAIEPPELEMRVAILIKKAEAEQTPMPEDVAFFIAKNVRANVRELEGALRKVLAYSRFSHKEINIQLAREALKDLLSIQNRQVSVENIQKTVADFYKIKIADMYSKKRPASIARPRQIAMYLAKEMTQKSLPEIGELFGGRDHTTVLHAVRKIGGERQKNTELNQQLHVLEQTLKG
ncbi:chromosomal replication initiator protein DnaA [Paucibacter sp. KBW04]|uniref:chromosomal replication initiator protein DnaA n=1 Tax=Paucibacter sp. KBW04 TaxID=2153361 RepID=UPI000F57622F|nr:chromosomal replication initiator protein DnaA [Paucibacter sp. KBW04]RQO59687.1 chromosomal replication initiator protein DnaA [Paucibacter sp. KBW04]